MGVSRKDFIIVILVGIIVGLAFAYIAQDIQTSPETLILLATVQGSFLAIVISVFLLSLQVNASVFSPLTLEQFGRSNTLVGLILLYVLSILIDVLHLTTLSDPLVVLPYKLNFTLGIPVGIATICLLSLIPIQTVMANLVAPETVLQRTVENASQNSLIQDQPTYNDPIDGEVKPPTRTPLLTIDQILVSSSNRDDEFTVRQSIYYMSEIISDFIKQHSEGNLEDETLNSGSQLGEVIDVNKQCEYIFEHWKTCIEIGTKGGKGRIELLNATHVRLTDNLINGAMSEPVDERLDELVEIHLKAFEIGYVETDLLTNYQELLTQSLKSKELGLIEPILSSILSICERFTGSDSGEQSYVEYLSGERRDVVAVGLSNTILCLETLAKSDKVDHDLLRRTSSNAITRIDVIIGELVENLDAAESGNADAQGIKQNILTELQSTILEVLSPIYHIDSVVAKNLALAAVELSILQEENSEQFLRQLKEEVSDEETLSALFKEIDKSATTESLHQISPPNDEVEQFNQELVNEVE